MPHDHHDDNPHNLLPSEPALRVKALETILTEKGLVDPAALDAIIDLYSHEIGPQIGAGIVAKAWTDDAFRAALLADACGGEMATGMRWARFSREAISCWRPIPGYLAGGWSWRRIAME